MNYQNESNSTNKEDFNAIELKKRLQKKFEHKAYHIRNQGFEKLARFTSYTFNIFSVLTAATAVYFFVIQMLHNMLLTIGITMIFMAILEIAKRTTGSSFIKDYLVEKEFPFSQFAFLIGLISLSVFFSYTGSKQAIQEFRAAPVLKEAKDYTASYKKDIAKLDEEIAAARKTTYKGTTTSRSQLTIDKATDQRSKIQDKVFTIEQQVLESNTSTLKEHNEKTAYQAYYFALATVLCELLFLLSLYYMELYDYRSYTELFVTEKKAAKPIKEIDLEEKVAQLVEAGIQKRLAQVKHDLAVKNTASKVRIEPTIAVPQKTLVPKKQEQEKVSLPVVTKEKNTNPETSPEIIAIESAIKAAKKKMRLANFRLKKGEGKSSTHLRNIEIAKQEIEDLISKRNAFETQSNSETQHYS